MSYINCDYCGHPIDSDIDDGCFTGETVTCSSCRLSIEEQNNWWQQQDQDDQFTQQ